MTKNIFSFLLAFSLLFSGCTANPSQGSSSLSSQSQQTGLIVQNEFFSLKLPKIFVQEEGSIRPVQAGDFPLISYSVFVNPQPAKDLLTQEKDLIQALCSQTDVCPRIIKSENISFGALSGFKLHLQSTGRSLGSTEGMSNLYQYSFLLRGNILRFRTSATDLEQPDAVEKQFDQIMSTIIPR